MKQIIDSIIEKIAEAFQKEFSVEIKKEEIKLQPTKKEFEGSYTFVTFPYLRHTKKMPEQTGEIIGEYLTKNEKSIASYNVVKGFLNLSIEHSVWINLLGEIAQNENYGKGEYHGKKVMIEYSSPNTNKPLHLGHLRNIFLGYSLSLILKENGYDVMKVNLINDRGIHICKSMVAYQKFGNDEEPTADLKGDKLAGNYYVAFDKEYKKQIQELTEKFTKENPGKKEEEIKTIAENEAPILQEAKEMLRKWEAKDPEILTLWEKMNGWVYEGFDITYNKIGVDFDKQYYESDTYLLGKDLVEEGLSKKTFFKKEDGSVWVDLSEEGLDEKLLLRADGTSVYITQDMGTADRKHQDFPMESSVYVVGNEQEYHFKVLKLIMKKLGRDYADGIYHLSYGMVDLPSGKMKSREGTVVDADDLIDQMEETAKSRTSELGKIDDFSKEEAEKLYQSLALGALKYYLLKVEPRKRMLFNPEESIDFQGDTGVYLQYNHAKISAITRKAKEDGIDFSFDSYKELTSIEPLEEEVIYQLSLFPEKLCEAGENYSPSTIAGYAYELAKTYSRFYAESPIFGEENKAKKSFKIALSNQVANTIKRSLHLLGIESPERM